LFWLADEAWVAIEPHLPKNQPGASRGDDRRVISGILHVMKVGCRWCDCLAAIAGVLRAKLLDGKGWLLEHTGNYVTFDDEPRVEQGDFAAALKFNRVAATKNVLMSAREAVNSNPGETKGR
jgi:hypothetical protein